MQPFLIRNLLVLKSNENELSLIYMAELNSNSSAWRIHVTYF